MSLGIGKGDTVSILAPNTPPMLEAHFGVPMCGAIFNSINYRLDAQTIAFILQHGEANAFIVDREYSDLAKKALNLLKTDARHWLSPLKMNMQMAVR